MAGKKLNSENHELLRKDFNNAINYLSNKLEEKINDIQTECELNGKTLECVATSETNDYFYVSIKTNPEDVESLSAYISIPYGLQQPFEQNTQIPKYNSVENRLIHWIDTMLYEMDLRYNSINLDTLFHGSISRIHTDNYYTLDELQILLTGVQEKFKNCKLIVYKFQHIEGSNDYRWFSYAFGVWTQRTPFWVLFLKIGGLDSGGAKIHLRQFENAIQNINVHKIEKTFNISYNKFERFLKQNIVSFHTPHLFEISFEPHFLLSTVFDKDFYQEYYTFIEIYKLRDYNRALRDLRALVQKALEIAHAKFNVPLEKVKETAQLCDPLSNKDYIPKYLRHWVSAFTSIANEPSHGKDPDLDEKQIQMIILLGMEIINVIETSFQDYDDL